MEYTAGGFGINNVGTFRVGAHPLVNRQGPEPLLIVESQLKQTARRAKEVPLGGSIGPRQLLCNHREVPLDFARYEHSLAAS